MSEMSQVQVGPERRAPVKQALGAVGGWIANASAFGWRRPAAAPIMAPYHDRRSVRPELRWGLTLLAVAFCFIWGAAFALLAPMVLPILLFPLLLLSLLVIWAIPELGKAPTGALRVLLFSFFVAMVIWPGYLAVAIPGLPRITILRMIGAPIVLLLMLAFSMSEDFRKELKEILGSAKFLTATIFTFYALQVISVAFSARITASLNILIPVTINWLCLFIVSAYVCARRGTAARLAGILCVMAVILVGLCFYENLLHRVPWAGHVPSFFVVDDPVVERILAGTSRGGKAHRVQATFSTALGLSEFFALVTPFLLHFAFGRFSLRVRVLSMAAIPLVGAACLMTGARTGLVGIFVALLIFPVLKIAIYWWSHRQSFIASALVLLSPVAVVLGGVVAYIVPGIRYRLLGGGAEQYSNQGRIDQLNMGIPKILNQPWGHGIGQGADTLGYTNLAGMLTIDSYPLRTALEYGIPGLILFYVIYAAALTRCVRGVASNETRTRESEFTLFLPLGVAFVIYLIMRSVFAQEDNQSVVYTLFGMVVGLSYRMQVGSTSREVSTTPSR